MVHPAVRRHPLVPLFLPHRGCTGRCAYCNQWIVTGSRSPSVAEQAETIFSRKAGPVEMALYGGNILGLGAGELEKIFDALLPFGSHIRSFRISTKPAIPDPDKIRLIKSRGVKVIEVGMPCFNDAILRTLNRGCTVEDFDRSFALFRSEGFDLGIQVMVGLPGETARDITETAARIIALRPSFIRIYPLVVLDNTPLKVLYEAGHFIPLTLEDAIVRSLYIYLQARQAGVEVIKMGLTAGEVLETNIAAGPYHPSFGYLVRSMGFYLAILAGLQDHLSAGSLSITLNRRDVPHLTGYRARNLARLEEAFKVEWQTADIGQGRFRLRTERGETEADVFAALSLLAGKGKEFSPAPLPEPFRMPDLSDGQRNRRSSVSVGTS